MQKFKKIFIILLTLVITILTASNGIALADTTPSSTPDANTTVTPTPDSTSDNSDQLKQLNEKIKQLEQKVSDLKSQENTVSSQINVMDNKIKLTEYRINATKEEIAEVTQDISTASKKIKNLEGSVSDMTKVLINRIRATYQAGGGDTMQVIMSSGDVSDLISRANYLRLIQEHDKHLLYDTQQARNDYANQKDIFESKKQKVLALQTQLQDYTTELDQEKKDKENLLQATKNDEAHSQTQLAQARAQINAFKSFATSRVGSGGSILPAQPSPDGWYYNQRDERWGKNYIGSSSEQVWEVGCLVTSMAMVMKKHGMGITPANVAANSSYFFSDTAYTLLPWAGGTFSTNWGYSQSDVDSKLASGEPVIVGLKAGPMGMHFIVLKSGSGGNYIINDPWNGPDLNFSSYYTTGQIFQYGYYNG